MCNEARCLLGRITLLLGFFVVVVGAKEGLGLSAWEENYSSSSVRACSKT